MLQEKKSKRGAWIALGCVAALLVLVIVLENTMQPTSMLFTVLKKGAVYALVAASLNLLNGFTGLFSLGQAGFMLLGAYTYAILTVPVSAKDSVYYLYGGSAVPFSLPDLFGGVDTPAGLILGVLLAILLGIVLFLITGVFLRDLERVRKIRWLMAAAAIALLSLSLIAGHIKYGAANWISLFGFSFQPSELAKPCYIFAGAATLERLFRKRNLGLFILLTGACMGCLALMSDFGTAAIFFVTFLVIAYLRSGDFATLSLICGGAVFGGLMLVTVKPYILRRFAAWGHAWEQASDGGFQQTRTMSAAASGGLIGVGPGEGWLHRVPAADTDLVFGMLCEEWGLIIAVLAVLCIAALAVFAVRSCRAGRSSFYTIAACAATSLLVFQTTLNVLGSVDILPLTGVTFPFVSNGGSSMLSAWTLLAFLKAADTRSNASFAIRPQDRHSSSWLGNLIPAKGGRVQKEVSGEKD